MDKSVERYLLEHGHEVVREPRGADASDGGGVSPGNYGEWFDERVLGLDSEGYRRAFWREAHATGHTIGHVPRTLDTLLREQCGPRADAQCGFLLAVALLQGGIYPFWLLARLLTREVNRLRRGTYYARERERRHRLADERRAIRVRRTVNPVPPSTRSGPHGPSSVRRGLPPRRAGSTRWPSCGSGRSSRTSSATSTTTPT